MSVTTYSTKAAAGCCGTASCTCAACQGLTPLVRPRFFAGQVLTETDLMALEAYAVDAHRMHNRYLHGPGVVCGLELACEDCGDGIVVHPGYGLDPCGRDLVVPEPQRVDIARLITDCVAAQSALASCEPPLTGSPKGCDNDETWCVTLRYREHPMRPITPLAGSKAKSGSCGCGAPAGGCGCNGNGHAHGASAGCGAACTEYAPAAELPPGCEPTRIAECFEIGVHRCEDDCCDLAATLAGTFPMRALECLRVLRPMFTKATNGKQQRAMVSSILGASSDAEATRTGICELYYAVAQLYTRDPLRTTCQLPAELQQIDCSPQGSAETGQEFRTRLQVSAQSLLLLVVTYLRACLCHALNPPCSSPCDDRIVLGCLTWRDGKVLEICNLQCRRYAGSFVSQRYWLPVLPVAMWALGMLCCFPLVGRTAKGRVAIDRALIRADPSGAVRRLIVQEDFAMVTSLRERATAATARLRPSALRERFTPSAGAVNLAILEGQSKTSAEKALRNSRIDVDTVFVDSPEALTPSQLMRLPIAEPGTRLVQFVHQGRVIGFGPAGGASRER